MGSKVPPKMPTLMVSPSLEIELHRPDPHFVSGLGPGPSERSHDTLFLQRTLEVLDPLGAIPVGPERHALHALAGDLVSAVLDPLDAQPLPGRPKDAVLALAVRHGPLGHVQLPEALLEEIPQPFDTLAGEGRNLNSGGEFPAQVPAQHLVEDVHLVEHHERGLAGEPGRIQLGVQGTQRPLRVLGGVEDEREQAGARDVAQKAVAQPLALAGPGDEAGDVRDDVGFPVRPVVHDAQTWVERGERVVADPGPGRAQRPQQRGFAGVGEADEADGGEDAQLQAYLLLFAGQAPLAERRRAACRGSKRAVAAAAGAAAGHHELLAGFGKVGEEAVFVVDQGADGDLDDGIVASFAGAVVAGAVTPSFGLDQLAEGVRFEGLEVLGGVEDHVAPVAAASAVGAAARLVLLAVERDAAVAAAPRANDEPGFIYELQRGY